LSANTVAKDHAFWADDVPVAEAVAFSGVRLAGHQQVTDAYLLGLAIRRGGVLATLDQRIASLTQVETVERKAVEFVG
jgi:predicted nucleic acid-binding protein